MDNIIVCSKFHPKFVSTLKHMSFIYTKYIICFLCLFPDILVFMDIGGYFINEQVCSKFHPKFVSTVKKYVIYTLNTPFQKGADIKNVLITLSHL